MSPADPLRLAYVAGLLAFALTVLTLAIRGRR